MNYLKWKNVWDAETTFEKTTSWYKGFYEQGKTFTEQDLSKYITVVKANRLKWS